MGYGVYSGYILNPPDPPNKMSELSEAINCADSPGYKIIEEKFLHITNNISVHCCKTSRPLQRPSTRLT